jgi:hypothetical protein
MVEPSGLKYVILTSAPGMGGLILPKTLTQSPSLTLWSET